MLTLIKNLLARNAYSIAIAITIFITITSLVSLKGIKPIAISIHNFDKIVHFTFYFSLALSWLFATQHTVKKATSKAILVIALISFGIIIEALQGGMTTHRQADFYDILANSIGVLLATTLFPKLNKWFNSI
jgi:VanZ family protein